MPSASSGAMFQAELTDVRFAIESLREGLQRVKEQVLPILRSPPDDMLLSIQGGVDELKVACDRHEKAMLHEQLHVKELKNEIDKIVQELRLIAQIKVPEPHEEKVCSSSVLELEGSMAAQKKRIDVMEIELTSLKHETYMMNCANMTCDAAGSLAASAGKREMVLELSDTAHLDMREEQEKNNEVNVQAASQGKAGVDQGTRDSSGACVHELDESVYEAMLLVGHSSVGRLGSLFIIFSFLVNVFLQSVFCIILQTFLLDVLPKEVDIRGWRDTDAHSDRYLSDSGTSLVSRVCNGDDSLSIAGLQHEVLQGIYHYTSTDWTAIEVGSLLCGVAIFIWLLFVLQEFMKTSSCVKALWMQPRGQTDFINHEDGRVRIVCLSFRRFCAINVVMFLRFGLALVALCQGAIWLANTPDPQDLVLNAAALTYVLQLQQIMFLTFVPLPVKTLVKNMEPLQSTWGPHWHGVGLPPFLNLLVSVIFVTFIMMDEAIPLLEQMKNIESDLCDGNLDFVYSNADGQHFGIIHTADSKPFEFGHRPFTELAIHDIIETGGPSQSEMSLHWTSLSLMHTSSHWGTGQFSVEIASLLNGCRDYDFGGDSADGYIRPTLRAVTGHATAANCSDVHRFCSLDNGLVRLVCPQTCGCSLPRSGLFRDGSDRGCPVELCLASENYLKSLNAIPCEDPSPQKLLGHAGWQRWWQEFRDVMSDFRSDLTASWVAISQDYAKHGCNAYGRSSKSLQETICWGNSVTRGIRAFCPVTCGCSNSSAVGCPTACMQFIEQQ